MFGWIADTIASWADSWSSAGSDGGTESSPSTASSFQDAGSDSCRFDNGYGTASDFQIPAEASSCFPSHDLTTTTYGSFESSDSWSSGGCGSSGKWD